MKKLAFAVANRLGWRLPSVQELTSPIDPTQSDPTLPAGRRFHGISSAFGSVFWTAATTEADASGAKVVNFSNVSITQQTKVPIVPLVQGARFWCVRGGSSVSNPPY
jgi:hypothetical protein